jgi:iron(III) transport system substrate-binding protein
MLHEDQASIIESGSNAGGAKLRTRLCALFLLLPLSTAATAQTSASQDAAWAGILAAARKEGRVTYYSAAPPAPMARMVEGFKKAYPDVAIEAQRMPSGPLMSKLDQERAARAEGADIANSTEVGWFAARGREGSLLKPAGPAARGWPAKYLLEGAVAIAALEPFIITYNTRLVPNPPRGYADLLRPEFRGRIGLSELASVAVIAWYDWVEKTQGAGYLAKLRAQNPKLYVGTVPIGQAVASGELAVGGYGVPTATKSLKDAGALVDYLVPKPGLGIRYGVAAFSWAKNPNAALVFLDYIMSREGQMAWNSSGETASPLPNIPGSLDAASIDPYDPALYPPDVEKRFREEWSKSFK